MVFKWLTYEKDSKGDGYHENWHFVDNVKESSVYWDEKLRCTCVHVSIGNDEGCVYPVYNAAFLLSDSGKTIERIKAPDWVLNQVRENSWPVPDPDENTARCSEESNS